MREVSHEIVDELILFRSRRIIEILRPYVSASNNGAISIIISPWTTTIRPLRTATCEHCLKFFFT